MGSLVILLVRSVHTEALEEMVREAQKEIMAAGFGSMLFKETKSKKWTQVQLWRIMQRLQHSQGMKITQKEALYQVCQGDKDALKALVNANILSLATLPDAASGKPVLHVVPFSPLYAMAFRRITQDTDLAERMTVLGADSDLAELHVCIRARDGRALHCTQ